MQLEGRIPLVDELAQKLGIPVVDIKPVDRFYPYYVTKTGIVLRVRKVGFRILKHWHTNAGHCQVELCVNGICKRFYIHHLVLVHFKGPRLRDMQARHLDGDTTNNHADNLVWGTAAENRSEEHTSELQSH